MATKRCRKCKKTKPLSQFYKNPRAKDGVHSYCKKCHAFYSNRVYHENSVDRVYDSIDNKGDLPFYSEDDLQDENFFD